MQRKIFAEIPTATSVMGTIEINTPADKVWALVGDYQRYAEFVEGMANTEILAGEGVGQLRKKVFLDGRYVVDQLSYLNDQTYHIEFNIIYADPQFEIRNLWDLIQVESIDDNTCRVTWEIAGEPLAPRTQDDLDNFLKALLEKSLINIANVCLKA